MSEVGLYESCTVRFEPRRWIIMAELERLVVNIVKFEVKTEAKMGAWREEIMA